MVLPDRLVAAVVEAKMYSALSTDAPGQLTLAEFITSHAYDRHIRTMRLRYRRRRDLLNAVLDTVGLRHTAGVSAGLQTLVELPPGGPSEAELIELASEEGLAIDGAAPHWHGDHPEKPALLIGFAHPSEQAYPAALALLGRVLQRALG